MYIDRARPSPFLIDLYYPHPVGLHTPKRCFIAETELGPPQTILRRSGTDCNPLAGSAHSHPQRFIDSLYWIEFEGAGIRNKRTTPPINLSTESHIVAPGRPPPGHAPCIGLPYFIFRTLQSDRTQC